MSGPAQDKLPKGVFKKEADVDAWGWNGPDGGPDGGMFFSGHREVEDRTAPNRPMGGWK